MIKKLTYKPFNIFNSIVDGDYGYKLLKKTNITEGHIGVALNIFEKEGLIKRKKVKDSLLERRGSGRKNIYKGNKRLIFLTKKGKKLKKLFEKIDGGLKNGN